MKIRRPNRAIIIDNKSFCLDLLDKQREKSLFANRMYKREDRNEGRVHFLQGDDDCTNLIQFGEVSEKKRQHSYFPPLGQPKLMQAVLLLDSCRVVFNSCY